MPALAYCLAMPHLVSKPDLSFEGLQGNLGSTLQATKRGYQGAKLSLLPIYLPPNSLQHAQGTRVVYLLRTGPQRLGETDQIRTASPLGFETAWRPARQSGDGEPNDTFPLHS